MTIALRLLACAVALTGTASAHLSFDKTDARAGRYYAGHLRVTHGCDGAATTTVRVEIPEGIISAHAQPKPGWTVSTERAPLAAPADLHGKQVTDRVSAIIWSGGSLPDDQWDEFGLMAKMPDSAGLVYFPTVQTCDGAVVSWTEIPAEGQAWGDVEHPAPVVTVAATTATAAAATTIGADGKVTVTAGALTIAGITVPEAPGGNGAVYLTIANAGDADRLTGGTSDLAAAVELHTMGDAGGVMEMRKIDAIEVPAGGFAVFESGGTHIMLIGLNTPLNEGVAGSLTLTFEKQGAVTIPLSVSPRGKEGGGHDHH